MVKEEIKHNVTYWALKEQEKNMRENLIISGVIVALTLIFVISRLLEAL